MVEISVEYEGGFHCFAIHEPSRARLLTDAPKDNLGKGEAFSPTDLTATSLGVCMLTTMAIAAAKRSLDLDLSGTRAIVRKHMTTKPPRRIQRLEVSVTIPLRETLPSRATLEEAALNCP
ncbi:MAG TPA: OsmC family protein, partial [Terrimicrobiaceae bacterium]|nr:OsmC family protein [Terrimicrobiaceae bacterium]